MYNEPQDSKEEYERKLIKADYETMGWLSPSAELADKLEFPTKEEFFTNLEKACTPTKVSSKPSKT